MHTSHISLTHYPYYPGSSAPLPIRLPSSFKTFLFPFCIQCLQMFLLLSLSITHFGQDLLHSAHNILSSGFLGMHISSLPLLNASGTSALCHTLLNPITFNHTIQRSSSLVFFFFLLPQNVTTPAVLQDYSKTTDEYSQSVFSYWETFF